MRVLYAYICACFVRIYTMVNHIALANGFVNIQHIPLQKDDSHQMLCMRQALVYHMELYMRWLKISKRPNGGDALNIYIFVR